MEAKKTVWEKRKKKATKRLQKRKGRYPERINEINEKSKRQMR